MSEKYVRDLVDDNLKRLYGTNIKIGTGKAFGRHYIEIGKEKIPIEITNAIICEDEFNRISKEISKRTGEKQEDVYFSLSKKPNFYFGRTPNLRSLTLTALAVFSAGLILIISFKMNLVTGFTINNILNRTSVVTNFFILLFGLCAGFLIIRKIFFQNKINKSHYKKTKNKKD